MTSRKRRADRPISDAEEAVIQVGIAKDPDNPEWTKEDFARARPFAEVFPDLAASIQRARGRPPSGSPKRQVTLRIDGEVLDRFRGEGRGWQSRINAALRKAVGL